ncbi:MAG: hypothetical protein QM790_14040 [Nibricoccus sp.]
MSDRKTSSNVPFSQPGSHRRALLVALKKSDLREVWWTFLNAWETRRKLRWFIWVSGAIVVLAVISWFWVYPRWVRQNTVKMVRQWMAAGRLDYAAKAVQDALRFDPNRPELWLLASELAQQGGQRDVALEYAQRAFQIQPTDPKYALACASAALQAGNSVVAAEMLSKLTESEQSRLSLAQRLYGEVKRREGDYPAAASYFEAAQKIDGGGAVNEVPLGLSLLLQRDPVARPRGLALLNKWRADPFWGAAALRFLLDDAILRNDRSAMVELAQALRSHPRCTYGDVPICLKALSIGDRAAFESELGRLKSIHGASPQQAAQLAGWLNQIGQSASALAWISELPADKQAQPAVAQARAEALHSVKDWQALREWTRNGDWGRDLDFVRWAYGMDAAKRLGDEKGATELWTTLYNHALGDSVHGHFAASLIYSWGLEKEAEALWWRVADQSHGIAYESLGALARHYQVNRDAEGQYRVFDRLHSLRPQNDEITNNFVFFAALTGNREQVAQQLAKDLAARHPENSVFRTTYAYVLVVGGRASEALQLLKPAIAQQGDSPGVKFVQGLALARLGEKEQAQTILQSLPPESLTLQEVEQIKTYLGATR